MKKLLAFLLLFASGIAALYWFERDLDPTLANTPTPRKLDTTTTIPIKPQVGVNVSGRLTARIYDEVSGNISMKIEGEDSETRETADVLKTVHVSIYDPETDDDEVIGYVDAREARLGRRKVEEKEGDSRKGVLVEHEYDERVELDELSGRFEEALAGSTLEFETPSTVLDASTPGRVELRGDELITFRSPAYDGSGEAFTMRFLKKDGSEIDDGVEDLIELDREGQIEFRRDRDEVDEETGELRRQRLTGSFEATGDGPMQVRRSVGSGERRATFEVWKGGRVELREEDASTLEAAHIKLGAVVDPVHEGAEADETNADPSNAPQSTIRFERIDADGSVRWTSRDNVFLADRGTLDFFEDEFSHATLTGSPELQVVVSLDEEGREKTGNEVQVITVKGKESIELSKRGDGMAYRVSAPASVTTDGATLQSNGELTGEIQDDGEAATFAGSGGIVLDLPTMGGTVEAAEIDLSVVRRDGKRVLRGRTAGGVRLVGTDVKGRPFTVSSPSRLDFELVDDELRVTDGRDVEFSMEGEEGFFARCDRVRNLDTEQMSFDAEGRVRFRTADASASGVRLEARGENEFAMWGDDVAQATITTEDGEAAADFLEVDKNGRLHARGRVAANVTSLPPGVELAENVSFDGYTIHADDLVLYRTETLRLDETIERRFHLEAKGSVRTRLESAGDELELRNANRLVAVRMDHFESVESHAPRLDAQTELFAYGDVDSHISLENEKGPRGAAGRDEPPSELDVQCDELYVSRISERGQPVLQTVRADGNVGFSGKGEIEFSGEGERLEIDSDRTGRLLAPAEGEVRLYGYLPTQKLPFRLVASQAEFSSDRIDAASPELRVTRTVTDENGDEIADVYRATAKRLVATRSSLELIHQVEFHGETHRGIPWILRANRVELEGNRFENEDPTALARMSATGGITFELGPLIKASAEALFGVGTTGVLRLTGDPVRIDTPSGWHEADWIDFDPELQIILEARNGVFVGTTEREGDGAQSGPGGDDQEPEVQWRLRYLWATTRIDRDALVYFMQEPVFEYLKDNTTMRSSWSILWVDRAKWEQLPNEEGDEGSSAVSGAASRVSPEQQGPMRIFFDFLDRRGVSGLVREAYFEGPVEVLEGDVTFAQADAVYFDLASGHGWLANATLNVSDPSATENERLTIKANWLRHSKDGSLRADSATITPCSFHEPHVEIVTGDLRLVPIIGGDEPGYHVTFKDNRIQLYDMFRIPLPPLGFDTNEELKPKLPSLSFGNSARFGQLIDLKIRGPARRLGRWFNRLLGFSGSDEPEPKVEEETTGADATTPDATAETGAAPAPAEEAEDAPPKLAAPRKPKAYDGNYEVDASYLGSRGALFDVGLNFYGMDSYWFDFSTGIVYDTGDDKGYVRVPKGDRNDLRLWIRSHGTAEYGRNQFLFAYSDQSDPAVQSEFFERRFENYEEAETYLQWKRRDGVNWTQTSVEVRVDSFRSAVEELPSATFFSGRAAVGSVGKVALVHTGSLSAGYLRRVASRYAITTPELTTPFGPSGIYPDVQRNVSVVRTDTIQTLEAPMSVGAAGLRFTPFASVRGTTWSKAVANDDFDSDRIVSEAGARLSTVLWKQSSSGKLHQVAPYVQFRELIEFDQDQTPYVFDETETEIFGDLLEVGFRSRVGIRDDGTSRFDLDLRGTYAANREDGAGDGWLPVEVFARADFAPGGQILDVWYDGRLDTQSGDVRYSLFSLGTRFDDRAGLRVGHDLGRDENLTKLFDAVFVTGFYRLTEKWEIEARQSYSLLTDQRLDTGLLLRRFGHDIVFDIETSSRKGEGASASFSVRPRLAYRPNRIGYTNW